MLKIIVKRILFYYNNKLLEKKSRNSIIRKNIFNFKSYLDELSIGNKVRLVANNLIGDISISDNAWIYNSTIRASRKTKIKIGRFTTIQGGATQIVSNHNNISIGSFCIIGLNAQLINYSHRSDCYTTLYLDKRFDATLESSKNSFSFGDIVIGHDCTIGLNAFIMPGVTLGNGCIVTPNSVVTSSFEPYSIIAGNPAVCIGNRFSKQKIEYLEELNWYEWEEEKIRNNLDLLLTRVSKKKEFNE